MWLLIACGGAVVACLCAAVAGNLLAIHATITWPSQCTRNESAVSIVDTPDTRTRTTAPYRPRSPAAFTTQLHTDSSTTPLRRSTITCCCDARLTVHSLSQLHSTLPHRLTRLSTGNPSPPSFVLSFTLLTHAPPYQFATAAHLTHFVTKSHHVIITRVYCIFLTLLNHESTSSATTRTGHS